MKLKRILEIRDGRDRRRQRRLRPPTPSKQTEVWYRDQLIGFVKTMQDIVINELQRPTLNDAPTEDPLDISRKLSRAIQRLSQITIDSFANRLAAGMIQRGNAQNKRQVQAAYNAAFGIDLTGLLSNEVVSEQLNKALQDNIDLIKSIQTDFINDIGSKVFTELFEGGRHENFVQLIRERGQVTESRAKFIARDQTSKLNSSLTEIRSKELGLDLYIWGGAGDERERDSHFVLNNMLCKYSDPTVYSDDNGKTWKKRSTIGAYIGNPGEDYQCRCVAIPYVYWD